MNNSNNWTGFGTIGNDLELQDHNGFKTTNKFTLFTKRNYKNRDGNYESDKIQCQASNKTAEFLTSRYQKGDSISVSGPIKTEDYTDKDGNNRVSVYVAIESIDPIISRKKKDREDSAATASQNEPYSQPAPSYASASDSLGEEIDDDDDLPF